MKGEMIDGEDPIRATLLLLVDVLVLMGFSCFVDEEKERTRFVFSLTCGPSQLLHIRFV